MKFQAVRRTASHRPLSAPGGGGGELEFSIFLKMSKNTVFLNFKIIFWRYTQAEMKNSNKILKFRLRNLVKK